ncbi:hypothetical protein EZ313_20275 [Ramlibacter henchirensis]|uniref:Secreted protein n=1 Tax=Ramlibacter henchirensis TaxID=204072 RepID=A0A4Z0BNA9_9BURK|nr:hypothetical protein [Ramlibacter henchirensis]TFZ00783.1 hypothetical protein EZ313_20275 [Ramlibacter henchirensis]
MRKTLIAAATLALAASGTAFAKPVKMTDQQMDEVTAGLVTVVLVDTVDVSNVANNNQVAVPVNAAAAVAVLGTATSVAAQRSPVIR